MQRSICLRWGEGAPSCQPPLRLPRGLSEPASPQTRFMASSGVVPPRKRTAWRARAHRGRRATPHENGQTQNFSRRLSVRWRRPLDDRPRPVEILQDADESRRRRKRRAHPAGGYSEVDSCDIDASREAWRLFARAYGSCQGWRERVVRPRWRMAHKLLRELA